MGDSTSVQEECLFSKVKNRAEGPQQQEGQAHGVHQCGSSSNPDCREAEKHCHSPVLCTGHQRHSPGTGKGAFVLSAFCLPLRAQGQCTGVY